jgi:hypothetical protein
MILHFILIGLSIACRAVGELQQHGKLRWTKEGVGFWGTKSDLRKYKLVRSPLLKDGTWIEMPAKAPRNFYYRYIARVPYRERWPTSTNFTVAFTDGYHLMQLISFLTLSLGVSLLANVNFFFVWIPILFIHATVYRILQR